MKLVIDFGNTRAKLAIFDQQGEIIFQDNAAAFEIAQIRELIREFEIRSGIYSSTRNLDPAWTDFWAQPGFYVLSHAIPWPFSTEYSTPETLGRDRVAGVAGALALFPGRFNLVIDIGTCITYDLVTPDRVHLGGAISPGIDLRLKAMHDYTDQLPLVPRTESPVFVATSTREALQAGGIGGVLLEIGAYIDSLSNYFEDINVIVSGGDAPFLQANLNDRIVYQPQLVLIGLHEILRHIPS